MLHYLRRSVYIESAVLVDVYKVNTPTDIFASEALDDFEPLKGTFTPDDVSWDGDILPGGCVKSKELAEKMFQLESRKDGKCWRIPVLISLIDEISSYLAISSQDENSDCLRDYLESIADMKTKAQSILAEGRDLVCFGEDGNFAGNTSSS